MPEKINSIEGLHDRQIWVLAERTGKQWETITLELLQDAQVLAKKSGWKLLTIVFGKEEEITDADCQVLASNGADQILILENQVFGKPGAIMGYSQILLNSMKGIVPRLLLCPSTALWVECACRLIANWKGVITTDCISFKLDADNNLEAIKSGFHNKAQIHVSMPKERPWCICLRPGVAGLGKINPQARAKVRRIGVKKEEAVRLVELLPPNPRELDLVEAERIIAGGRGIQGVEGFKTLEELAFLLEAAVGASRVAVDMGWVEYARQVGQTGKTVKPRLYLAVGISGASQHVDGMRESEIIIAINQDKNANIFKISHLGIIGDADTIIRGLIAALDIQSPAQAAAAKA